MKPMRAIKLLVWEFIVDGRSLWRATAFAVALACGFPVAAQEPDESAQTNDVMAAEILAQLSELVQAADFALPEDVTPPADMAPTNRPASGGDHAERVNHSENSNRSQGSSRSQVDERRSRARRSSKSSSGQPGGSGSANDYSRGTDRTQTNPLAATNNGPVSLDYAAFKIVVDRNIFDPNRYPHRPGEVRVASKPRSVDSLTLVGTMSYEKGTFAFFDGTSSDYKKALKLTDSIAGYKVTNIAANGVKLASGTNELELSVGAHLRREEDGPWLLAGQSRFYAATTPSASTNAATSTTTTGSDTASGGAESDILKRLMQKREKE